MTRVSLREAYDNRDVVAQIYAIRDTAESAVDTSEQAVTTANTASDHVDALVPQVEGAVANANSASASAQASAQTVAGYENRLGAVEMKVTTAEGQIVTIQGRVTALETADGQNVKLTGEHAIGNYAVLLTGNQDNIAGNKGWLGVQSFKAQYPRMRAQTTDTPSNFQLEVLKDGDSVPVSRILLDKDTQYSGIGNTTHHLVVIGGRHTDGNGNTHDVGLRLSYNELTGKFVLSMNGVTISEVSG